MILKWLQSVFGPGKTLKPFEVGPLDSSKLIDVAHEVLAKEAKEKQLALKGFEKYGWPFVQRKKFEQKVRSKVKRFLSIPLTSTEEFEMVDEITEKITETAEADPRYRELFEDSEETVSR